MVNVVNKLTKPGNMRRIELSPDRVVVTLYDHTEITYVSTKPVNNIPQELQFTPEVANARL
jgi:hypothetical protein